MKRLIGLGLLAAALALASAPGAFAFSTVTSDDLPSTVLSTRLADPDDIIQGMDQRYGAGTSMVSHFGGTTVETFQTQRFGVGTGVYLSSPYGSTGLDPWQLR
jgi:hypothetical protein